MNANFTKKYLSEISSKLNAVPRQDFANFIKLLKDVKKKIAKLFLLEMVEARRWHLILVWILQKLVR